MKVCDISEECRARVDVRNTHKILIGKPDEKRPLGRPKYRLG
jgi:hypothetical protein